MNANKRPAAGEPRAGKRFDGYLKNKPFGPACQVRIRHRIAQGHLYFLEEVYLPRPYTRMRSLRLDRALVRYEEVPQC